MTRAAYVYAIAFSVVWLVLVGRFMWAVIENNSPWTYSIVPILMILVGIPRKSGF